MPKLESATHPFVHLHLHTQYSLLDGAIQLKALFTRVKEYNMDAVAITDHGTMFGVVDFYEKARAAGVKPIIGCECYVAPRGIRYKTPEDRKKTAHLILLAETMEGYQNLCKLATIAQLEGFYSRPRVDKDLLRRYHKGLIAMSACLQGEVPKLIRNGDLKAADAAAKEHVDIFGPDHFFLEVQNNGMLLQDKINEGLLDMHQRLGIPMVASNDCHYLDAADVKAHEVLLCIQTNKTIHDASRFKFSTEDLYFKPGEKMAAELGRFPGAIDHTRWIADRCNVELDTQTFHFPQFETPRGKSEAECFEEETRKGFAKVMAAIKEKRPEVDEAAYNERLEYELKVIIEMDFAGYFLIVADFIRYAKDNRIPVGPGRGSAAGSLVAYSLGITGLDPIAYDLLFERFLNPGRKSMPDIDVDFCINGREKVFDYVVEKYGGGDYVSQIITYGSMKAKAVIRDVARALAIPLSEADTIAKLVPDKLGITLAEALDQEPKLRQKANENPDIQELLDIALTLEGLNRHASTHAAGVVIADKPLREYLPLYRGKKGEVITQFDMNCVEKIGLVKFDFLGLRNLTVIDNTLGLVERQGRPRPDPEDLDLNDPATFQLLGNADTTGVFQLESDGMKGLLARMKPSHINDIIALVALYRPGPLDSGMSNEYVDRKLGNKKVVYLIPELEPILKNTYGVIVYQEQIMRIVVDMAGYSMSEADDFRKAMGKKKMELIDANEAKFIDGAVANGVPENKAHALFDLMKTFGRYGFNKSHSAAYAMVAYQTAYLKAHYPVEFLAALFNSEIHLTDKVVKLMSECRERGIEVLPPDINASDKMFTVVDSNIRFGLLAVKNIGEGPIDSILAIREEKEIQSVFDFCERVDLGKANKRVLESLIKCGAFDCLGQTRASLTAVLETAMDHGACVQRERNTPQMNLFANGDDNVATINPPVMPQLPEWDDATRLAHEKEVLGFYISGHPLANYQHILDKFTDTGILGLAGKKDGQRLRVGGVITHVKNIITKKRGESMARITLEGLDGSVQVTVFPKLFPQVEPFLTVENRILVEGNLQREEKNTGILATDVIPVEAAEEHWTATIHFKIDLAVADSLTLTALYEALKSHPGDCKGFLHLGDPDTGTTIIAIGERLHLKASQALRRAVALILGEQAVFTVCKPAQSNGNRNGRRYFQRGAG